VYTKLKENIIEKLLSSLFINNNWYITVMHFLSFQICGKCNTTLLHQNYTDDTQEFHPQIEPALTENSG
jgi:hypothetical protein